MYAISFIFLIGILNGVLFGSSNAYTVGSKARISSSPTVLSLGSVNPSSTSRVPQTVCRSTPSGAQGGEDDDIQGLRSKLRQITGFSLTAFRSTWRAATGISLTAVYASAIAASGLWIRKIMSTILSITPPWFRYFLQPFLVLYYAPLFILRGLTGPTRKEARAKHKLVVDGWKEAVEYAEQKTNDLPAHVNVDGEFELDGATKTKGSESQRLADAVAESVEQASEQSYNERKDL